MSEPNPSSDVPPVVAIFGEEDLLVREAVAAITKQVFPDGAPDLGITEFEAADAGLADVLDELRTLPFLAERRLVLLRGADPFITKHREALERYVASPSTTGVLVLIAKNFDGRTRLYKAVEKTGRIIKCQGLYPRQITAWINDRARNTYQKTLDRNAAAKLRDLVGNSLATLDAELDKLSLFVGSRRTVTVDDIEVLVGQNREEKVFGIIDAMASGQTNRALELWHQVWATDRAAVGRAIGGLAFSIRRLLEAKQLADEGVAISQLARKFWTEPDVLAARLQRYSVTDLQDQLAALLEANVRAKTGWTNVRDAVEKFIVTQSAKSPRSPALAGSARYQ